MRHVVGFLFGLILGPVLVLACGWVFPRLKGVYASGAPVWEGSAPVALAGLAGVGLVVALLVVPSRLTPMAALVSALAVGGLSVLSLVRADLLERLPESLPGAEGALSLLPLGVFVPLVVVLVAPVFSGARWRGEEEDDEVTTEEYFEGLYEEGGGRRSTDVSSAPGGRHAVG
ncbi:hypothetical protein [Nocardiopsis sp. LOL_012]|uniref:hypothetical protein n=1 Tax=Nocardiopsis sp. LOL_012 TaxID=3345409 RepID=UPI003A83D115